MFLQYGNTSVRIFYGKHSRCKTKNVFNETAFTIFDDGSINVEGKNFSYNRYCINYVETFKSGNVSVYSGSRLIGSLWDRDKLIPITD
jgi:hypothetical protein